MSSSLLNAIVFSYSWLLGLLHPQWIWLVFVINNCLPHSKNEELSRLLSLLPSSCLFTSRWQSILFYVQNLTNGVRCSILVRDCPDLCGQSYENLLHMLYFCCKVKVKSIFSIACNTYIHNNGAYFHTKNTRFKMEVRRWRCESE